MFFGEPLLGILKGVMVAVVVVVLIVLWERDGERVSGIGKSGKAS